MKISNIITVTLGMVFFSSALSATTCSIDEQITAELEKIRGYRAEMESVKLKKAEAVETYNAACLMVGEAKKRSVRKYEAICWTCKLSVMGIIHKECSDTVSPVDEDKCAGIKCGNAQDAMRTWDFLGVDGVGNGTWEDLQPYMESETSSWIQSGIPKDSWNETQKRYEIAARRAIKVCTNKNPEKIDPAPDAQADCLKSCGDWYAYSKQLDPSNPASLPAAIKAAQDEVTRLESIRSIVCPGGSGPAPTENEGGGGSGQQYFVPGETTEEGSTASEVSGSSESGGSGSSSAPSGTGISVTAPKGSALGGKGKGSWYDKAMALYKGSSSGSSGGKTMTRSEGSGAVGAPGASGGDAGTSKKQAADISNKDTDIFKIINNMYQYRYVAGLVGQGISEKSTKPTAVKEVRKARGVKKPVIYK